MNTTLTYFLRQNLDQDISGPFTPTELGDQFKREMLDDTAQVIPAEGQSLGTLKRSEAWVPVSSVVPPQSNETRKNTPPSQEKAPEKNSLSGYAGWLAFFGNVSLYLNPLLALIGFLMFLGAPSDIWEQEPTIMVLGLVEILGHAVIVFLGVQAALALRRLDPVGVHKAKVFLLWGLLWSFVPIFFSQAGSTQLARDVFLGESIKGFLQSLIGFAIWFSYFNVSKRVQATFSAMSPPETQTISATRKDLQNSTDDSAGGHPPTVPDEDLPESRDWNQFACLREIPDLANSGQHELALEKLNQAEWAPSEADQRLSDFAFIHSWRIRLLIRSGKQAEAKAALIRGLQLARQKSLLCNSYATTLFNHAGEFQESVKWWVKSANLQLRSRRWTTCEPFLYLASISELLLDRHKSQELYACADQAGEFPNLRLNSEAQHDVSVQLQQADRRGDLESIRSQVKKLSL